MVPHSCQAAATFHWPRFKKKKITRKKRGRGTQRTKIFQPTRCFTTHLLKNVKTVFYNRSPQQPSNSNAEKKESSLFSCRLFALPVCCPAVLECLDVPLSQPRGREKSPSTRRSRADITFSQAQTITTPLLERTCMLSG